MSGIKGRSGRRPKSVERKRLETIDKAWDVIYDILHSVDIPLKDKATVAEKIVSKDLGRNINLNHSGVINTFQNINLKGKTTEEIVEIINNRLSETAKK